MLQMPARLRLAFMGLVLSTFACSTVHAVESPRKKLLLIGIDGCRYDAVLVSKATTLKELAATGAVADPADVLGDRKPQVPTYSGPGWSSIFTGVWADKHGVSGNFFEGAKFEQYPSFFQRLRTARPEAKTVALVSWKPFQDFIFAKHPECRLVFDGDAAKSYVEADQKVAEAAAEVLAKEDPDALFVFFGNVDSTGHGWHFHPTSPKYVAAIDKLDGQIQQVLAALKARQHFAQEDWLVIVCTDHGGRWTGHTDGATVPEIRNGFLILNGPSVERGKIENRASNVDVAVTALTHLGVPIQADWKLDGQVVGLRKTSNGSQPKSH